MSRILLDESLSSDAFDGTHSKKAFREPQLHTLVQSIRLTSLSWREIASTGQTQIELRDVTVDVPLPLPLHLSLWGVAIFSKLCGPQSVLSGGAGSTSRSGLILQTCAQISS